MAKKELHFFGSDLQLGPQIYRRDFEAYLEEFNGWSGQSRVGETSVWYLFSSQAAAEIKTFNPDARIIIMLREPLAMLYSLYNQFRFDGNEQLPSFQEALAAEEDRSLGRRITRRTYLLQGLAYRAAASYTEQVRRYFEVFGRDRVRVIIYDDFAANTVRTYRETLEFLEVAPNPPGVSFDPINESMSLKSPLLRNIMSDPLVRGTAIAMRPWVPRFVFTAFQQLESFLVQLNRRPTRRSPLPQEFQLALRQEFAPEVERLSALLGRDLTHWSRSGSSADTSFKQPPRAVSLDKSAKI